MGSSDRRDATQEELRKIETAHQDVADLLKHPGWAWIARAFQEDLRTCEAQAAEADTEFKFLRAQLEANKVKQIQTVGDRVLNRLRNDADLLQDRWK